MKIPPKNIRYIINSLPPGDGYCKKENAILHIVADKGTAHRWIVGPLSAIQAWIDYKDAPDDELRFFTNCYSAACYWWNIVNV